MKPQLTELLYESNAVAFQVCDPLEGNSARGDWTDEWGGVVRPLLKWETQYSPEPIAKFEIGLNPAIGNQLRDSQSEIKI